MLHYYVCAADTDYFIATMTSRALLSYRLPLMMKSSESVLLLTWCLVEETSMLLMRIRGDTLSKYIGTCSDELVLTGNPSGWSRNGRL